MVEKSANLEYGFFNMVMKDDQIFINFEVSGLPDDLLFAAIHDGENGPVIEVLKCVRYRNGVYKNPENYSWDRNDEDDPLTQELVDKFLNGDLYVRFNIMSAPYEYSSVDKSRIF